MQIQNKLSSSNTDFQDEKHMMKTCFMTGRQCIYCSTGKVMYETQPQKVFVIMQFSPNLETCYRWRLRPFIARLFNIPESNVQRADDVREIGYIICEKICRKIQDSSIVVAELSFKNPNVFYELGISYGLGRPTLLIRDEESHESVLDDSCLSISLNVDIKKPQIIDYPGIGELSIDKVKPNLANMVLKHNVSLSRAKQLKIAYLKLPSHKKSDQDFQAGSTQSSIIDAEKNDINVDFYKMLESAIGVAMAEIKAAVMNENINEESNASWNRWVNMVREMNDDAWLEFSRPTEIPLTINAGRENIIKDIESSFCVIIDITNNDPSACFWLGYCHARGLNVIPIHQTIMQRDDHEETKNEREHNLAFDIRALWYAEYDLTKPYDFKTKLREIIQRLLERYLPDRQKQAFWDHIPTGQRVKILTGAIHNNELDREMVGDWDVRTVSELLSYLPSIRESSSIELMNPMYSPEQALKRAIKIGTLSVESNDDKRKAEFINMFRDEIEQELKDVNAIVIASPETNPVTEYLLHKIYNVKPENKAFEINSDNDTHFNGFIVAKQKTVNRPKINNSIASSSDPNDCIKYERLFYHDLKPGKIYCRGFLSHTSKTRQDKERQLLRRYYGQDECTKPFELIGHLLVARNPFSSKNNIVIILNGVSGPATCALAEVLTGGISNPSRDKNTSSEIILETINKLLDTSKKGVEAIIEVSIEPPLQNEPKTLYPDSRRVTGWKEIEIRPIQS